MSMRINGCGPLAAIRQTGGGVNLLSQSGAGVGRAGGVNSGFSFGPGRSVGVADEARGRFRRCREAWDAGAALVGRDFIEAEDTDENHAHNRSGEKKGLPTGLKCNTLHVRLPRSEDRGREMYLSRDIG